MIYRLGDRVRWATTDGDGLPLVRYGFVRATSDPVGPVAVMFDGELGAEPVAPDQLEAVTITTLDLCLDGDDLLEDSELRRGLAPLWQAEAEDAGLDVVGVVVFNGDAPNVNGVWTLAHFTSGGERYALKAARTNRQSCVIRVHAEPFSVA
jgi:hypothetical protein